MGDEESVENRKKEKRIKLKSKKGEKSKASDMVMYELEDINRNKEIEYVSGFEKDDVVESKKRKRKDREKKKNEKTEGADDVDLEKRHVSEAKLIDLHGVDSTRDAINNVEKKKKKTEKTKNKNEASNNMNFEVGNAEEVEVNDGQEKPDEENVSKMKSKKEAKKPKRQQEMGNHNDVVEKNMEKMEAADDVNLEERHVSEGKLIDSRGEGSTVDAINSVERKKKKKEKRKNKNGDDNNMNFEVGNTEEVGMNEGQEWPEKEIVSEVKSKKGSKKKKRREDLENRKDDVEKKNEKTEAAENIDLETKYASEGKSVGLHGENSTRDVMNNVERKKKKKKEKRKNKNGDDNNMEVDIGSAEEAEMNEGEERPDKEIDSEVKSKKTFKKQKKHLEIENHTDDVEKVDKKKGKEKKKNASNKKVRFSSEVEIFPLPDYSNIENEEEDNLVRGKRFTLEENEIVKEAVNKYIEEHELGEDGLNMVLNVRKHPKLKGCWKEIGAAIPYRPYLAIYNRAQVLLRSSQENRKWTKEEYDMIINHQRVHGNQWKELAEEFGTHHWHVKDVWRRIKLPNKKKGNWSQVEYQRLFNLVNTDLQLRAMEEKRSKHGMLRDNISWTAISDKVETRSQVSCCLKWYNQLTSPMVVQGVWADVDDYRMINELYSLDANCIEDVDWDNILDDRSGDFCRTRWNQMVLHIGHHGNKSFAEQVEVLAQRYCPNLIEARETWDSKPRVP